MFRHEASEKDVYVLPHYPPDCSGKPEQRAVNPPQIYGQSRRQSLSLPEIPKLPMQPANSIRSHLSQDPILAQIIAETPAIRIPDRTAPAPSNELYLALLESIVSQQISVKAADAIFARFLALFPDNNPRAELLLLKTTDELRSAGLSFQKIKYLQSVAEFSLVNPMERAYLSIMTDEEIVQYLIPIKGVGRWTVEMLLMFTLDRPDILPIDDLIIRQKMIRAYPEETGGLTGKALYKALLAIADPWRPYRTTASRYLWRWKPAPLTGA